VRIIAGTFRSRPLTAPAGEATRPTSDKLRGALFNILTSAGMVEGKRFLDLYAGSGAVGIEAISRGAAHSVMVENDKLALRALHSNLKSFGITREATVLERDVTNALHELQSLSRFDVIFLDPPWKEEKAYQQTLEKISPGLLVDSQSTIIAEHEKHFDPGDVVGKLQRMRVHKQGDAVLSFYRLAE
jgi:16S rRNA (guanine(966)-N(2))-methyltransferase RsmD